jgi:hypothetical protein
MPHRVQRLIARFLPRPIIDVAWTSSSTARFSPVDGQESNRMAEAFLKSSSSPEPDVTSQAAIPDGMGN